MSTKPDQGHVGLIPLMTWSDYAALAANPGPRQIVLSERPLLSEQARFGGNFVLGGKNRSLAVDGSDEAGYRFYADADGNGQTPRSLASQRHIPTLVP